jgi:glycosyltransferase involved in cell wall biosynthesis
MEAKDVGINLSVVVPIGTTIKTLQNLKSWIPQAVSNCIEVILVIDTDDEFTLQEINSILKDFPLVKKVVSQHRNPGGSRNLGLSSTTRKWVSFIDSDDELIVSNMLKVLQQTISSGKQIGVGQYCDIIKDNKTYKTLEQKSSRQVNLVQISINPGLWRFIFLKSRINGIEFPNLLMAEDQVFLFRLNIKEDEAYFSEEVFYKYYIGEVGQLTLRRQALNDLAEAHTILLSESLTLSKFQTQILIRISLSCFKHLQNGKYWILLKMYKSLLQHKWLFTSQFVRVVLNLSTKNRGTRPSVLVVLTGGLGNQLFQLAYAFSISQNQKVELDLESGNPRKNANNQVELRSFTIPFNNNGKLYKPRLLRTKTLSYLLRRGFYSSKRGKNIFKFDLIFFLGAVINSLIEKRYLRVYCPSDLGWDPDAMLVQAPSTVFGYFQSYLYSNNQIIFNKLMSLNLVNQSSNYIEMEMLIKRENPLIIHVRLGDYKSEPTFGILSKSYYKESLAEVLKSKKFTNIWIFSDEPELALEFVDISDNQNIRLIASETLTDSETFQLMRHGAGYIIANSSFSWWSAYLRYDRTADVYLPNPWFKSHLIPNQMSPKEWRVVNSDFTD